MQRQNWEMALSAQAEILAMMTGRYGNLYVQHWLHDRASKYGRGAALPSAMAFDSMVDDLIVMEPLYVAPDMHHLVLDAMQSFDRTERLHEADVLFPAGFAFLPEPFVAPDNAGKMTAWRAIAWRLIEVHLDQEFAHDNHVPIGVAKCLKVHLWSHLDDKDDYTDVWMSGIPEKWGCLHATVLPLMIAHDPDHTSGEGDPHADWVTYLRVLHRIMAERIVVPSRRRPSRPVRREAQRRGLPHISDVLVVELRRVTVKHEGEPGQAHYSHSFMVRGHWRNQWYPSLQTHRQKWIHPYVKGEGDFIEKERVWIWDR